MKPKIDLIGVLTDNIETMKKFYTDVLGFEIELDMEKYIEFKHEGVRFAICTGQVMKEATGEASFKDKRHGHSFELAFLIETPEKVDTTYKELIGKGATPIKEPADMPWGQRTAFFADPDGNIHEIFAELPKK